MAIVLSSGTNNEKTQTTDWKHGNKLTKKKLLTSLIDDDFDVECGVGVRLDPAVVEGTEEEVFEDDEIWIDGAFGLIKNIGTCGASKPTNLSRLNDDDDDVEYDDDWFDCFKSSITFVSIFTLFECCCCVDEPERDPEFGNENEPEDRSKPVAVLLFVSFILFDDSSVLIVAD